MFSSVGQAEFALVGLVLLIPIIWIILTIVLCIWVYRDAQKRGMNGTLWLIIVLIAGIIGFIIYLVVRKDKVSTGTTSSQRPPT